MPRDPHRPTTPLERPARAPDGVAPSGGARRRPSIATLTLPCEGRVVAIGAFVSVSFEGEEGVGLSPLLFLPDECRRFGVEPRRGDRWSMDLAVEVDQANGTILGVRLVGLAAP